MNNYRFYLTVCLILCFLSGCRQELPMIRSEVEYVTMPSDPQSVEGFFLVNEGNMGSNKCTIGHFDARTGSYFRNIYPERNPDVVKELGDVGNDIGIGVDFHGRVHKPMAKVLMKELDAYKLMFIEEPVLSENYEALKELAPLTSTPIALGERLFSRWDFKRVLSEGYVDIIQPDASHAGGITETRKIANMAEAYDVALALHCPLGPIALAACLQLDAVCYNAFIQEQSLGIHYNESNDLLDYVKDPRVFDYDQGFVKIPNGPGLGIEINEEYVIERAAIGHRWRNPIWRHADGSFAEW